MHVAHILTARLHVMVNGVRRYTADLHQAIVLDEYRITGEVSVDDGRRTGMQITIGEKIDQIKLPFPIRLNKHKHKPQSRQYLCTPPLPRLQRQLFHVALRSFEELFE